MSAHEKANLIDAPAESEQAYPSTAWAWYTVAILLSAYIFSFIDRQILNLLVAPVRRDLGITDTEMSLLIGFSFAVFYSVLGLPFGRQQNVWRGVTAVLQVTHESEHRGGHHLAAE